MQSVVVVRLFVCARRVTLKLADKVRWNSEVFTPSRHRVIGSDLWPILSSKHWPMTQRAWPVTHCLREFWSKWVVGQQTHVSDPFKKWPIWSDQETQWPNCRLWFRGLWEKEFVIGATEDENWALQMCLLLLLLLLLVLVLVLIFRCDPDFDEISLMSGMWQ